MPQTVKGVIARSKGAPVELVDVVVPDPGPGEAVVVVQACGVCHTDLHYREGGINDEFPFLLGHEAAPESTAPIRTPMATGQVSRKPSTTKITTPTMPIVVYWRLR